MMAGPTTGRGTVRRLFREIRLSPSQVGGLILCALCGVAASAVAPLLVGRAVDALVAGAIARGLPAGLTPDEALRNLREQGRDGQAEVLSSLDFVPGSGVDVAAFAGILLTALALFGAAALLNWGQGAILNTAVHRGIRALRQRLDDAVVRAPLHHFDGQRRGDIVSRATNDVDVVTNALSQVLGQLLSTVLSVVVLFGIMFWLAPDLALITLILLPLAAYLTSIIIKKNRSRFITQMRATGAVTTRVDEMISGHEELVSLGGMDASRRRFRDANATLADSSWKAQFVAGLTGPVASLLSNLSFVAICLIGVLRVLSGTLTLGEIQVFVQYNRQLNQPVSQAAQVIGMLQAGVASADRIFEILDWPLDRDSDEGAVADGGGVLEFDDVRFAYEPEQKVLDGVSFVAPDGEAVALVGRTGAGKSTLIDLVCGFRHTDGGEVRLGGLDVRLWNVRALRERVGVVSQDTWIFHGTIRENIAYGTPDGSADDVEAAADVARVTAFARALPDGLDTVLDDGGTTLSHGERQLVCIARVFAKDPEVIILDEATTSVDTRTEMLIQHALHDLAVDRTVLTISHRLTTILASERVVVLADGRIGEIGTAAELANAGGSFARMLETQLCLLGSIPAPLTKEKVNDDA